MDTRKKMNITKNWIHAEKRNTFFYADGQKYKRLDARYNLKLQWTGIIYESMKDNKKHFYCKFIINSV